jgi:hypothetical protein
MRAPVALGGVVCLASSLALGCDAHTDRRFWRFVAPTIPSSQPAPVPAPLPPPQAITLGEVVSGWMRYTDPSCDAPSTQPEACRQFALASPRSGTLVVQLSWDPHLTGTLLLDHVAFKIKHPPWAPVVGYLPVAAGQHILLSVILDGSDWYPDDPFTLTTALE